MNNATKYRYFTEKPRKSFIKVVIDRFFGRLQRSKAHQMIALSS